MIPMTNDHNSRLATPADSQRLLKLINLIQPHVPWDEEMLRWQFFEGPAGPAMVYVIEADSKIVAQYVAVPYKITIAGSKTVKAWMIQDVMTHPDYRGQGMLHALGKQCLEAIHERGDYGFTFPNEKSAGSFRRTGWHRLCSVPLRSFGLAEFSDQSLTDSVLVEVKSASELNLAKQPVEFGVERSEKYLTWRYAKPRQNYRLFNVADQGHVVLKKYNRDDGPIMHLCDVIVLGENRLSDVLTEVKSIAKSENCQLLTAWLAEGHPYASAFDSAGLKLGEELPVSIYVTGPESASETLREAGNWHITQGDSDVY